jgi:hypothetical protein
MGINANRFARWVLAAVVGALFLATSATGSWADLVTNDVSLSYAAPGGPTQALNNLGTLTASSINGTGTGAGGNGTPVGSTLMSATFTVSAAAQASPVFSGMKLHWVQKITADSCPANYMGKAPTFPVIDPPSGGWDYEYVNPATRSGGIAPEYSVFQPNTGPWYYNAAGDAKFSTPGQSYTIQDQPGNCPAPGTTSFVTFLVAEPTQFNPGNSGALQPGQFLLLAGFSWQAPGGSNPVALSPGIEASDFNTALTNGGYNNISATYFGIVTVPEPATIALIAVGGLALLTRRRKAA